jgi:crotonobetainyl-CoA:carnitine CoA-transferase CaiB-like acyl-CoA transferase
MCSISGMGATGPERNYVAYGSNIEASAGLVSQLGYGDGLPFGTGSYYADPIAGTHATIAITSALLQRETTGAGQFIDMALQESGMVFNVEALMDYQLNGRIAGPSNNRSRRIAPQGAYRSAGIDCWLAIGVETDEQWRNLCDAIGQPGLASTYPTLADRIAAHDAIDAAISAWSAQLDHQEAARRLQSVGVPAGPVLANWEIVSDPHLYERGYFVDVVHAEVGHYRWDGYPWKFSKTPGRIRYASPLFGEHNDEILCGLLGLSREETADLRAKGVVADEPIV